MNREDLRRLYINTIQSVYKEQVHPQEFFSGNLALSPQGPL